MSMTVHLILRSHGGAEKTSVFVLQFTGDACCSEIHASVTSQSRVGSDDELRSSYSRLMDTESVCRDGRWQMARSDNFFCKASAGVTQSRGGAADLLLDCAKKSADMSAANVELCMCPALSERDEHTERTERNDRNMRWNTLCACGCQSSTKSGHRQRSPKVGTHVQ